MRPPYARMTPDLARYPIPYYYGVLPKVRYPPPVLLGVLPRYGTPHPVLLGALPKYGTHPVLLSLLRPSGAIQSSTAIRYPPVIYGRPVPSTYVRHPLA